MTSFLINYFWSDFDGRAYKKSRVQAESLKYKVPWCTKYSKSNTVRCQKNIRYSFAVSCRITLPCHQGTNIVMAMDDADILVCKLSGRRG